VKWLPLWEKNCFRSFNILVIFYILFFIWWRSKYSFFIKYFTCKKVTVFCAIFEVNIIIGEVWYFMAQFENKYWENYQYLKYLLKKYCLKITHLTNIFHTFLFKRQMCNFMVKLWDTFWSGSSFWALTLSLFLIFPADYLCSNWPREIVSDGS